MAGLLASVTHAHEARIVLDAGADIIDLKDPAHGALGALPLPCIRTVVANVGGRYLTSATVGDLPADPHVLTRAVAATAATGVDFVKVGLFGTAYFSDCLDALAQHAADGERLIAVLFADLRPDFNAIEQLAAKGFSGVMLDTANKQSGGLRSHLALERLFAFVKTAKRLGLITGLAGSLRREDIVPLVSTGADYLGFRTALCRGQSRTAEIDPGAVAATRACLARLRTAAQPGRHVAI